MEESTESSTSPETVMETDHIEEKADEIDEITEEPEKHPEPTEEDPEIIRQQRSTIIKFLERSTEVPRKYNTNNPKRGKCIIVNFYKSHYHKGLAPRFGSEHDVHRLQETFRQLNFDVETWNDEVIRLNWFLNEMKEVAKYEYHNESDCFVMVIMCHGESSGKLHTFDGSFKPKDVWEKFTPVNCPALAGKPKFFFFQACRGSKMTKEAHALADGKKKKEMEEKDERYSIPVEADILLMFSTLEDKVSFRDPNEGSPFILSLCGILQQENDKPDEKKEPILNLLTSVARSVAAYTYMCDDDNDTYIVKQLPTLTSTLLRLFYLVNK